MNLRISHLDTSHYAAWDHFVGAHPCATLYHLSGWRDVIHSAYAHAPHYLMAHRNGEIAGILPLVRMKSFIFGDALVSIPFFDMGGILAEDVVSERALLNEAVKLAQELGADLDLRHHRPLACLPHEAAPVTVRAHKARMLLELPPTSDALFNTFKSKLRSQIKKPLKEGLTSIIGGEELIQDFYTVFSRNMRDLGSPVHSLGLIENVLAKFREKARIAMVYAKEEPVAAGLMIPFNHVMQNPWASALREHRHLSPNMLLYWSMLAYACDNGCRHFDFGRSTPGEGTYHFKAQWGAKPEVLHWYSFYKGNSNGADDERHAEKDKFSPAIEIWKRLPVPFTRWFGPMIRRQISL